MVIRKLKSKVVSACFYGTDQYMLRVAGKTLKAAANQEPVDYYETVWAHYDSLPCGPHYTDMRYRA
jgi:hypothetical protein